MIIAILGSIFLASSFCIFKKINSNKNEQMPTIIAEDFLFGKYEMFNGKSISLVKDKKTNTNALINQDNETIYKFKRNLKVETFFSIDENELFFVTLNNSDLTNIKKEIYHLNLDTKESMLLTTTNEYSQTNIWQDNIVVFDEILKKIFLINKNTSIKEFEMNYKPHKIINSQDELLYISNYMSNDEINSKVFKITNDGPKQILNSNRNLIHVELDALNNNKLYCSYKYTNIQEYEKLGVFSTLILNKSLSNVKELPFHSLEGYILSTKTENYLVNKKETSIYSLDDNFAKSKLVARLHPTFLDSFLKVDHTTGSLCYIDISGKITSVSSEGGVIEDDN